MTSPPPRAPASNPAIRVASRDQHSCAVRARGDVLCWGKNTYGQLGNGSRVDSPRQVQVAGLTDATDVAVGRDFSCALRQGGRVSCWGNNEDGQLGDGRGGRPGAMSHRPVVVSKLRDVTAISLGEYHGCALARGGQVLCWGNAANGQLGSDAQRAFASPRPIARLSPVVDLASGANHVCALERTGTVKCWGRNTEGQLGDGKSGSRIMAVAVAGIRDAKAVASGHNHSCAVRASGSVACWGANQGGQLGARARARKHDTPVVVAGLERVAQIAGGDGHSCARLGSGRVVCWGANDRGQLGGPASGPQLRPKPVRGVADAVDLSLGRSHSCAVRRAGQVSCWGADDHSSLGPHLLAALRVRPLGPPAARPAAASPLRP